LAKKSFFGLSDFSKITRVQELNASGVETFCRAMKGEVDQLHKKISLGLRLGFSELRPRLTLSHPPTFGIFGNSYDDGDAI
jgi:hypothetical protein